MDMRKGDMLLEKIVKIEEIGERNAIDIEVDGNHLFYANDILTHNSNSDVELTDTSESFGLPATADFMFALIKQSEELSALNQIMVKQLKNRYTDAAYNQRFVIGIDRSKMKLYDCEQSAQEDIMDGPVMDNTKFGYEDNERSKPKSKFDKFKFDNFK